MAIHTSYPDLFLFYPLCIDYHLAIIVQSLSSNLKKPMKRVCQIRQILGVQSWWPPSFDRPVAALARCDVFWRGPARLLRMFGWRSWSTPHSVKWQTFVQEGPLYMSTHLSIWPYKWSFLWMSGVCPGVTELGTGPQKPTIGILTPKDFVAVVDSNDCESGWIQDLVSVNMRGLRDPSKCVCLLGELLNLCVDVAWLTLFAQLTRVLKNDFVVFSAYGSCGSAGVSLLVGRSLDVKVNLVFAGDGNDWLWSMLSLKASIFEKMQFMRPIPLERDALSFDGWDRFLTTWSS